MVVVVVVLLLLLPVPLRLLLDGTFPARGLHHPQLHVRLHLALARALPLVYVCGCHPVVVVVVLVVVLEVVVVVVVVVVLVVVVSVVVAVVAGVVVVSAVDMARIPSPEGKATSGDYLAGFPWAGQPVGKPALPSRFASRETV